MEHGSPADFEPCVVDREVLCGEVNVGGAVKSLSLVEERHRWRERFCGLPFIVEGEGGTVEYERPSIIYKA